MTFDQCAKILIAQEYTFAKSMPQNPHWYTLRKNWGTNHFEDVVKFIRDNSYTEHFHGRPFKMFKLNGYKYWTMGAPLSDTILINRAVNISHNDYDVIADQYQGLFHDDKSEEENREVISKIDIKGSVLDIGCGSGLLLDYAKILPLDYVGIDPSFNMLGFFKKNHPDYFTINCAFEDFAWEQKFDTIISLFGSPSYITPGAISRVRSMLNKNGTAFLMFYKNDYTPVTDRIMYKAF
jgi:SAM-dependent methyltransferase